MMPPTWRDLLLWLWMLWLCCQTVAAISCKPDEYNMNGVLCCGMCQPGRGVFTPCSAENNTVCEQCEQGASYSGEMSHIDTCHPCRLCPLYSHVTQVCNTTHDTQCECDRNYFFDKAIGGCRPCESCPMGFGVKKQCNSTQNTQCVRCPQGTFSDRRGSMGCGSCALCGENQLMLQMCNYIQDTICVDLPSIQPTDLMTPIPDGAGGNEASFRVIPIYCSILGLVVVALVICVFVKNHRRRKLAKQQKKSPNYTSPETTPFDPAMYQHGSDSGVYMEHDATKPVLPTTPVRDLPLSRRKAVENLLYGAPSDRGGWRALARELGYSVAWISKFESAATQDGQSPLKYVLMDWAQSETAVVATLTNALRNIGREDVARALVGDTREYAPPPRYGISPSSQHIGDKKGEMV